jgi:hypothetical protein
VIAAELRVGLCAEDTEEQFRLHRFGVLAGGFELTELPADRKRQEPAEANEQVTFKGHDSPARNEAHGAPWAFEFPR